MRIAIDVMGGDYAPKEVIKGALAAVEESSAEIILVGNQKIITSFIAKYAPNQPKNISIVHASQIIEMDESPASAVKAKKDCSINVGLKLVKDGKADGFVSAGNTGAVMTAAVFGLGRVRGIERPAIASVWPTVSGNAILLDVGANADCKPKHLYQFAQLGSVFAEKVFHKDNPTVGLLSIGEEDKKGNELVSKTQPLLKKSDLNFVGNVESKDIFSGDVDVFVCDGFVGNMLLKLAEGMLDLVRHMVKDEIKKSVLAKCGALMFIPAFKSIQNRINYEEYGGALLLGVRGVCVITHGRAKAATIKNAIKVAKEAIEADLVKQYEDLRDESGKGLGVLAEAMINR